MICPHCFVEIHPTFKQRDLGSDIDGYYYIETMICPREVCKKLIISLKQCSQHPLASAVNGTGITKQIFVRPLASNRPSAPTEVEKTYADDFNEACLIMELSPKASAALSRRCLHNLIINKIGINKANLHDAIQELMKQNTIPSYIIENLDIIRQIGNIALHPKTTISGDIVNVEPHEAEWMLDILDDLFDFYFVSPAKSKARKDKLNEKMEELGKSN